MKPSKWEERTLSSLVQSPISYGVVQTGEPVEHGVPCVRVVDIASGNLDPMQMVTTSTAISNSYKRTILSTDDVIMALRGVIGRSALVSKELEKCNLTRGVARISLNRKLALPNYVFQFLNSSQFQSYIERQANGSALQEISIATLRKATIKLPSLQEQRRIADILSTWDQAIEATEKLIANSEAQKKALLQNILTGKKRLSGFKGAWKSKRIDAISDRVTRRNDGEEHPILTISSTVGFLRQDERYSRYMAGRSVDNYILLKQGEFAYNKGNSKTYEFGCVFELDSYTQALVPHVYVCFSLKSGYSHAFYRALFQADYLRPQLGRIVNTGVRNNGLLNITPSEFLKCKVPVPQIDEQEAIAEVFTNATDGLYRLHNKLEALRAEKASLMQQLLTGKRRVNINGEEDVNV